MTPNHRGSRNAFFPASLFLTVQSLPRDGKRVNLVVSQRFFHVVVALVAPTGFEPALQGF